MPSDPNAGGGGWIPLSAPELDGNEAAYLQECVATGWVSSAGPFVDRLERELAEYLGAPFAVATVNGTSALHLALLTAGIRPDDEVVVPALTFIASANAVRYVGAHPVFIDVEAEYMQLDVEALRRFLEDGCRPTAEGLLDRDTGRRVSAIVAVHLLGHPVEMDALLALARTHGLTVIEDASQGLGAEHRGRKVGTLGDVGCFSFNGNKLITAGGGGMLVASSRDVSERARYLSTQAKDDALEFVHGDVGYNYRMPNVNAAVACAQLERSEAHLEAKRRIAARYDAAFRDLPGVRPMREAVWAKSAWWLYTVSFEGGRADSRGLMRLLAERGIEARPLWQPLNESPAHPESRRPCPVAERLNDASLCLPSSVGLTARDQARVIEAVHDHLNARVARHSVPV